MGLMYIQVKYLLKALIFGTFKNRPRPAAYWRPACCCVFPFLAKIRKFKMAAIFGEGKIFLKINNSTFLLYPAGRKFRRNRSISHG